MNAANVARLLRELADAVEALDTPAPAPVSNFATCLAFTLRPDIEGGFVNNPADPGGATNHGITLTTFRNYMEQSDLTAEDLRNISPDLVAKIYEENYWTSIHGDELPPGVDLMVFDMGVNAGPGKSVKLLQRVCGVAADGIVGPETLAAAATVDLLHLHASHEAYYHSLRGFGTFGRGWITRLDKRYTAALAMVKS